MEKPSYQLKLASSRMLAYTITSLNPKRPVILLSGPFGMTYDVLDDVVAYLECLGFVTLRYNLPGHGRSGIPDEPLQTTFDSLAEDVHELLTHLGITKLHAWIGVNFGAMTAITFASKYPGVVGKLILSNPVACSAGRSYLHESSAFCELILAQKDPGNEEFDIDSYLRKCLDLQWMAQHPRVTERLHASMHGVSPEGFKACFAAIADPSFDIRTEVAVKAGRFIDSSILLLGQTDVSAYGITDIRWNIGAGQKVDRWWDESPTQPVTIKGVIGGGPLSFVDGFDHFVHLLTDFLEVSRFMLIRLMIETWVNWLTWPVQPLYLLMRLINPRKSERYIVDLDANRYIGFDSSYQSWHA
ncbi:Alpha/Beta hydrolase protein [Astrocystis sublimbata]|nr:Alpha/Beta hydrolase protein [Astrocystis sublimbata]